MDSNSRKLEPVLSRMTAIDWFSRVGEPESAGDARSIEGYLSALGRQGWRVRYVHSLESVKLCTKSRFDPGWFDAEEEYRQQLIRSTDPAAFERINLSLKSVIDRMSDPVMEAAERNLEGGDLQILKVAAGCAIETCYQYALESAISPGPSGIFSRKLELFEQGRWPLTASENKFVVY